MVAGIRATDDNLARNPVRPDEGWQADKPLGRDELVDCVADVNSVADQQAWKERCFEFL